MAGSFRPGICGRKAAIAPPIAAIKAMTPAKIATLSLPPSLLDRSFSLSLLSVTEGLPETVGAAEVLPPRPSLEDRLFTRSWASLLDLSNLSLISLLGSLALSSTLGALGLGVTEVVLVRPSLEEVSFSPSLILALGSLSPSFLDWSLLLSAGFSAVADAEAGAEVAASSAKAWGGRNGGSGSGCYSKCDCDCAVTHNLSLKVLSFSLSS